MALTKDRNTPRRDGMQFNDPVAANAKIFAGSLVCLDASGNAVPGALSTTIAARGIAQEQVDNTGGAAGISVSKPAGVYSSSPTVPRPTRSPAPTSARSASSSTIRRSPRPLPLTPARLPASSAMWMTAVSG